MSYTGPWRNRLHELHTQYAYLDEVKTFDPKLCRLLELEKSCFDNDWFYRYPKKKKPESRQVIIRMPVWMDHSQQGRYSQKGDERHRKHRQLELQMEIIPHEREAKD